MGAHSFRRRRRQFECAAILDVILRACIQNIVLPVGMQRKIVVHHCFLYRCVCVFFSRLKANKEPQSIYVQTI